MPLQLKGTVGLLAGQRIDVGQIPITIGSHPSNAVVLNDPQVSLRHARVVLQGSRIAISDLGSASGTFVNSRPVSFLVKLNKGDTIQIGSQTFVVVEMPVYRSASPAVAVPPSPPNSQFSANPSAQQAVPLITAEGFSGTVELYADRIIIKRGKSLFSHIVRGFKGDKQIMLRSITAIQLKRCGIFLNGFIQFSIPGGQESKRGIFDAVHDENTVTFINKQQDGFIRLNQLAEQKIGEIHQNAAKLHAGSFSPAEELGKVADLRDKGIITQQEFEAKKRQLGF